MKSLILLVVVFLFSSVICHLYDVDHSKDCQDDPDAEHCPAPLHVAVHLHTTNSDEAKIVAERVGMKYLNKIGDLPGHFIFGYKEHHRTNRHKREVADQLSSDSDVRWAEVQRPKRRVKRDLVQDDQFSIPRRSKRSTKTSLRLPWQDPLYRDQWYLHNGAVGGYDMKVREAWRLGFSGKGVSVSILDDGIQRDHADLAQNYDPEASSDINDHDDDPMPQNNGDNKHGSRCAGEVAAVAGNTYCGVGIAFDAKIGGVRMLDGPVSDSVEAASLALNQQHIDIYSASWGPEDDGRTVDGPGPLAREAFRKGITEGRGGKGNIFVWASGNGGSHQDSCSADGYTTSIFTLSISSATFDNRKPWYLEECPSTISTTYSSASMNQPAIVTVDVPNGCTKRHTGTSASAPIAAGIIALALEANPNITWRDMQHIVLRTSNPTALLNNPGWSTNGVGRKVSTKFGYGLMDAEAIVKLSRQWKTVPEQHHCEVTYELPKGQTFVTLERNFIVNYTLNVGDCDGQVKYLEHIQAMVTAKLTKRGDLKISLVSPSGSRSVLLPPRPADVNGIGLHNWPFLSVQQWGENPRGIWTLIIENVGSALNEGQFHGWSMVIYGTSTPAQPSDPMHGGGVGPPAPTIDRQAIVPTELTSESYQVAVPRQSGYFVDTGDGASFGQPTSVSYGPNVGSCHYECTIRGCHHASSASGCYECTHFNKTMRNRYGFQCVSSCDEQGYFVDGKQCRQCLRQCNSCSAAEICDSCHSGYFLVQVNYGHFHHGQCVEKCSEEFVEDHSDPAQPKCVRPKNPCGPHQFFYTRTSKCLQCAKSCNECYGPTTIDCISCASGYKNTTGPCKICCTKGQVPNRHKCVNCSIANATITSWTFSHPATVVSVICISGVVLFLLLFACFMWKDKNYDRDVKKWAYSQLPIRYDLDRKNGIMKPGTNGVTLDSTIDIISDSDEENIEYNSEAEEDTVFEPSVTR